MSKTQSTQPKITTVYAPTGYGKSTRWVAELASANPTARILVVEPAVANAISIAKAMNKFYPELVIGYKTGLAHNQERFTTIGEGSVNYITPHIAVALFKESKGTAFDIVVIDEAHSMNPSSHFLVIQAKKYGTPLYLVSATLPTWCKAMATSHIDLTLTAKPLNQLYEVTREFNWNGWITPSEEGNTLVFVPSLNWLKGGYSQGNSSSIALSDNPNVHLLFGGTKATAEAISAMAKGKFPESGQIIFTNNALSTGVTIPNVRVIFDYGLAIKVDKSMFFYREFNSCNFEFVNSWLPKFIDQLDAEQRAGRGGRVCDTVYYCAGKPVGYKDSIDLEEFVNLAFTLKAIDYKNLKKFYLETGMISKENLEKYQDAMKLRRKGKSDLWSCKINTHLVRGAWQKAVATAQEIEADVARRFFSRNTTNLWQKLKTGWRPVGWNCYSSSSDHFAELRIKDLKSFCKKNSIEFKNIRI